MDCEPRLGLIINGIEQRWGLGERNCPYCCKRHVCKIDASQMEPSVSHTQPFESQSTSTKGKAKKAKPPKTANRYVFFHYVQLL